MTIITGMHRSGTSLIAEILCRCGLDFGEPSGFYPADRWNPRGYFEQRDVIDLNNRIICGLPRTGGMLSRQLGQVVYLTMPRPRAIQRTAEKRSRDLFRLGVKYQGKAVKDPRFCLTLSQWDPFVRIDSVVICLRGPRQTALSLRRRQHIPLFLGFRFWAYHMENLLKSLKGRRYLVLDYDRLADPDKFRGELQVMSSILHPGVPPERLEEQYRAVFEKGLRHFAPDPEESLPPAVRRIWGDLLSLRDARTF